MPVSEIVEVWVAILLATFVVGRFGWGLLRGQRIMLVALLAHCAMWFVSPFLLWFARGVDFEWALLFWWAPLLLYAIPVTSGLRNWRKMGVEDPIHCQPKVMNG